MIHNHHLTLAGLSSPSQFTLTHEHERSDEPHDHAVIPEGKTDASTTFVKTIDPEIPHSHLQVLRESEGNVASPPTVPPGFASQFDYPTLRVLVDDCVRALNNLVVAHTREGLDMPVGAWKAIEEADYLVNSVQSSIPVRTIVRYPAYIDVHVESRVDEHRMVKTKAHAWLADAGIEGANAAPFVFFTEDDDVADAATRASRGSVWPDPELEG